MEIFEKIKNLLDSQGVEYRLTQHAPVRTSEEAAKVRGASLGTGAKAMIVKSKDKFFLLVLPADKRIDWKKVKKLLGVSEIRFATEEEAEKVSSVKMGSVPPFGNIINLPTYFDHRIREIKEVNFNPGSTTHTINMRGSDLINLVKPEFSDIT